MNPDATRAAGLAAEAARDARVVAAYARGAALAAARAARVMERKKLIEEFLKLEKKYEEMTNES